ncbi:RluA family pseudouridine synthase [Treponema sp.]|uniref:RluA family pseudouridine synthase n=1 Tax=Treponema sp. TaxID=166 RepID=UPI00388E3BCC
MKSIEILFEDEHICVINKPAGLLSVPSQSKDKSALSILEEIMRKKGTYSPKHRPFAVHRLDRDTSGVMMFALSEHAQKIIMDSWHKIVSERLYRAVAENPKNVHKFLPKSGLIDDNLAFNANNIGFVPRKDENSTESEKISKTVPARTHYTTVFRGKTHSLFELSLDTGKKNQIRAHLASKGYPLAGDKNYRAKTNPFDRLCLHARTLEFTHPFADKKMRFEVKEPAEWELYVQKGDFQKNHEKSAHKKESLALGKKRLSTKDKAHMNFIEIGKKR